MMKKEKLPERVKNADLRRPVLTIDVPGGVELVDGAHRWEKARATGKSLRHIKVTKEIIEKAVVKKEVKGKQYAAIDGKSVDIEKLWKLTAGMKSRKLDLKKVIFKKNK